MDSQDSGKGKSPVSRMVNNKGASGKRLQTQQAPQKVAKVGVPGQAEGQGGKRDRGPTGGGQPRGGGNGVSPGNNHPQGTRRIDSRGRGQETPTMPQKDPWPPEGFSQQAPMPNPSTVDSPLLMDVNDSDRAPYKLFTTLKPLTGKSLSLPAWTQWCKGLERWMAGLSQWVFEKPDSPQQAWSRRQGQKRWRPQGANREVIVKMS